MDLDTLHGVVKLLIAVHVNEDCLPLRVIAAPVSTSVPSLSVHW